MDNILAEYHIGEGKKRRLMERIIALQGTDAYEGKDKKNSKHSNNGKNEKVTEPYAAWWQREVEIQRAEGAEALARILEEQRRDDLNTEEALEFLKKYEKDCIAFLRKQGYKITPKSTKRPK